MANPRGPRYDSFSKTYRFLGQWNQYDLYLHQDEVIARYADDYRGFYKFTLGSIDHLSTFVWPEIHEAARRAADPEFWEQYVAEGESGVGTFRVEWTTKFPIDWTAAQTTFDSRESAQMFCDAVRSFYSTQHGSGIEFRITECKRSTKVRAEWKWMDRNTEQRRSTCEPTMREAVAYVSRRVDLKDIHELTFTTIECEEFV